MSSKLQMNAVAKQGPHRPNTILNVHVPCQICTYMSKKNKQSVLWWKQAERERARPGI
jgi:hypothetical protein